MQKWIQEYKKIKHEPVQIYDGIQRKKRTIIVPTLQEAIIQHCVVQTMKPLFYKGMYYHSYASIPNRGAHKGKRYIEKWIRKDVKNTQYILKMDIRHFFESVPHETLKIKLATIIKDTKMLSLLFEIIDTTESGLPLGFYTSQWLSNWYLQSLDHYIKEQLHAKYYIRYMDDMVIFGADKAQLHEMRQKIQSYLENELGLTLKSNWQVFPLYNDTTHKGRDLDFMGFRFFRTKTILRRSIYYKMCRKAKRIAKKPGLPNPHESKQLMSYWGWIKDTHTFMAYLQHIRSYISLTLLRNIISIDDKKKKRRKKQLLLESKEKELKRLNES